MDISKLINKTMELLNESALEETYSIHNPCDITHVIEHGGNYYCSRPKNHKGYHIAYGDKIFLIWENEKP